MKLPRLQPPKEGTLLDGSPCRGQQCQECALHFKKPGGRCGGCTPQKRSGEAPSFLWCYKQCHTCVGFKIRTTGVCCRSPLRDMYMTAVSKGAENLNLPQFKFKQRAPLQFNQRAVFYISSGGVNTIASGGKQLIGDHEVAAVNISRVWGSNGFYSKDLKDYLHMSPNTKLILLAMSLDDLLERAWDKEMYADPTYIQSVGIDYWHPLSFSAYPANTHMHQYYQYLRTLYATEKSEAWFVSGDHYQLDMQFDDLFLQSVDAIPQVVINTQFISSDETLRWHLRLLRHYHKVAPARVSFWLVGAMNPTFMHNARAQCGTRAMYYFSSKPLYLASKGQELTLGGKSIASSLPKLELVQLNYEMFAKMVANYG